MIELLAGQRQKNESGRSSQACNDYLRLGPGRSLNVLLAHYRENEEKLAPTRSIGTLNNWSARYKWQIRAELYDKQFDDEKTKRKNEIMQSGLAFIHERVQKLKELASFLETQMFEQGLEGEYHNIWLPDVKQIGGGEYAERVDIERFNSAIIEQYRGTLDDIAKETGGRIHKQELTGSDGDPLKVQIIEVIKSGE